MIKVDTNNSRLNKKEISLSIDTPIFTQYTPDFSSIEKVAKKYKNKKNIIIIANGGSRTSCEFFCRSLGTKKKVHMITSMEPDLLYDIKSNLGKKDTVIIAISKSGDTIGVIESLMYFLDYPSIVVVTENKKSPLKSIQEKYKFNFVEHHPIGGRFSGFTAAGLLPAAIAGIDIHEIWNGAKKGYMKYAEKSSKNNPALQLASALFELDKKGFTEIFMPIYSSKLAASIDLVTQLIHESSGKSGKGPTLLATQGPECQHHTNQRFFGGRRNMLGCFVVVDEEEHKYDMVSIPNDIRDIKIKDGSLADLNENFYAKCVTFEFLGTYHDAINNKIPSIVIHHPLITPESIGNYLAFWHYVTVYLCTFLGVNPYDQPQVENSKKISFNMRKKR